MSSTDSDVFTLFVYSRRHADKWVVEMKVVQNGQVFTIDIKAPDGQPFATTSQCLNPQWTVGDNGVWDAWSTRQFKVSPLSNQPWSSSQLCEVAPPP